MLPPAKLSARFSRLSGSHFERSSASAQCAATKRSLNGTSAPGRSRSLVARASQCQVLGTAVIGRPDLTDRPQLKRPHRRALVCSGSRRSAEVGTCRGLASMPTLKYPPYCGANARNPRCCRIAQVGTPQRLCSRRGRSRYASSMRSVRPSVAPTAQHLHHRFRHLLCPMMFQFGKTGDQCRQPATSHG